MTPPAVRSQRSVHGLNPCGYCWPATRKALLSRSHSRRKGDEPRLTTRGRTTSACPAGQTIPSSSRTLVQAEDLVDRAVRQRDHEEISVGPGPDVGRDAEVPPEQPALALGDI